MRDLMLDHGLDQLVIGTDTGYFQVTFPGPGADLDRLRVPAAGLLVTPAVEAQLNDRQKKIIAHAAEYGFVTSGWCRLNLPVVYDTIRRDLLALVKLGILRARGKGRSTRYVLRSAV
jgi:predicted HTH transcriptional regulator